MATDLSFMEYVVDQIPAEHAATFKHMFGEFGLFSHGRIIGLVCDNQLFIKPTDEGRAYIGDVVEAPPYPGAKPSFLIGDLDDREWLGGLVGVTVRALPPAKARKKRTRK